MDQLSSVAPNGTWSWQSESRGPNASACCGDALMEWWLHNFHIVASVIVPVNIVVGIPASFFVVACIPFATIRRKAKLFYVLIAVCGLPSLIFCHLFNLFLMDVLPFWTDERLVFRLEALSAFSCQFARFATGASENLTAYVTLLFAFERLFVVSFPFRASWFTAKRSARYVAGAVGVALGVNCLAFMAYGPRSGDRVNAACSPLRHAADAIFATHIINYFVPNTLLLIVTIWIYVALRSSGLVAPTSVPSVDRKRSQHKTTIILVAIAAIRCVLYIPGSVMYMSWQFVPDTFVGFTLRMVANQFLTLAGLASTCNFIVYLTMIRSFRHKVFRLLTCSSWWHADLTTCRPSFDANARNSLLISRV